ncbi:MAG: hypothetical protein AAF532_08370 [Planctomycetota bacterium]
MSLRLALAASLLPLFCVADVASADDHTEAQATEEVKIRDVTLAVPTTWTQKPPSNRLRLAEFDVPSGDGEETDTQVVVSFFGGGGGGIGANVTRWIGQFDADGREVSLVEGSSPQGKYTFLDLTGTMRKSVGPPFLRKYELIEDARSVAIILTVEGTGNYFLKLAGPRATVDANADALLASFGADRDSEKPLDAE